ncbi:DoxX family protein [Nocardia blacklockiae]|uniref:DoxX family protein n=1 Tax=Nocardia blacklockiae TaxID=480036 RepID=UPI001895E535|nr:DoxX family protein [Nocardia blacklockiae]MBF6171620.1 DoxX family protein [Nocardia blacklockiae]
MFAVYVAVAVVTAVANFAAAGVDYARNQWVLDNMTSYGVPHAWIVPLGVAKTVGAVGLLVGLAVPVVGVVAGGYLVLYFVGAVATVLRARCYADVVYPSAFLLMAVAALGLAVAVA